VKTTKKSKSTPVSLALDIVKLFDAQMRIEMLKNGMKTSYKQLLRPLSQKDGITQLDLVGITKLKAPTISTTLRNMEADGLVRREPDKDDARATRVFITEKGREADKKMRSSNSKIEKEFLSCLNEAEKEQLAVLLTKIKAGQYNSPISES
jgi:DNA-binding MarR family transcriptional regulator